MEAVPKLPLISFELKVTTENTHFGPKLKQYIAEAYREDPDSYGNEIHQLEGLRSAAVRPTIDTAGLNALIRYFCQLRAIQSRFPMGKGQPVACPFAWRDLYANMTCSLADIKFEMACILYNIGALHTQLGASEPRTSADSLKSACQHFQHAAWAFQFLREQYPLLPGADLVSEILRMLQEICFAQAQECILDKSIQDTRKPSVIGSVATQVMYFYKNSLAQLGPSCGTENINEIIGTKLYNYWHRYLSFKLSYIGCIVCLYQGIHAEEQQKMGERVAFYQQAVDKLAEARKLVKYIEPVQVTQEALTFTNDVVEGKRKAAKNENEFIYHEEVPEKDMLTDLKPVCLVSAVAINFNDPEVAGPDIFSRLVPMVAHEASSMYSEEKAKLLRHVGSQVDAKNTELTEFMSSLQLDQLDVLESEQKVPQEIVDRCAAMNAKSEIIQTLVDSMNNLAEIISDVEHSLDEIKSLIQEETMKEKEYQKQMGPRPPSIVQTEISREYHKYQEAHARTNESNQVLHKAMTLHIANLRLLSQPLDVLQNKIPSIENIEGLDRETMKEMRYVVGKAREMQKQRDSLVQQLRTAVAADDVTSQLLARSNEPPEDIFKQEIEKHTPTVKIIDQNLAAQENIINKLTSLYASYGDSRRMLSDVLRKREGLINALITSYDTHAELLGKSQKGLEFYRKLSHNVSGLLSRLRSVCQVQREERAQMMATQKTATPTPVTISSTAKVLDTVPVPTSGGTLKLKDYLPYMKNRSQGRTQMPQVQPEPLPNESYYPETIYPTSVRPAPVGSEATELTQPNFPDGVIMPQAMQNMQNPYARHYNPYAPTENDPYNPQTSYAYPMTKYSKPEENYSYSSYTPSQYSSQMPDPQTYTNPYYSATQNNSTAVTDSQNSIPYANMNQNINPNSNQYNVYSDPYMANPNQMDPNVQYNQPNQDFNTSFAQMNISAPKSETMNYSGEYAQTHYSVQYPQSVTPNMATYSNAGQNSNTNIVESQLPPGNSMNYPYTTDQMAQYGHVSNMSQAQNIPPQQQSMPMQNIQNGQIPNMSQGQNIPPQQQNIPMQIIQNGQIPNMSQAQNIPPQQQNIPMQNTQNGQIPNMSQAQNILPQQQNIPMQNTQNGQIPNMSQAQNIPPQQQNIPMQNIQNGQIPNMSQAQNIPPQQQNIPMQNTQNGQIPNMSQAQNIPPQQQNMLMQNNQNGQVPNMSQAQNIPPQQQNIPVQNIQNPMQNVVNPMQTMPSSVQSGTYPIQNISNPVQNFPNSTQNIQTSLQSVQSSTQHISNPMQTVQNPNVPYAMQNMPNTANFSNSMQNTPTSIPNTASAIPTVSGYGTDQQYSYSNPYENVSQGYVYTNAENTATTTTSSNITAFSAGQTYSMPNEPNYIDPSLSQIDAFDKPIKSHVTGEALSSVMPNYQNYKPTTNYGADQAYPSTNQPAQYADQTSYAQTYQNHPGYTYNATSGNYEYTYGSQNAYSNYGQQNMDPQSMGKDPNWAASGTYTNAGACDTVQSPSETPQMTSDNNAIYYNLPYGYLTATNQANEIVTQSVQVTTNYGANMNNSTYMQSGYIQDTSVTFTSNQVTNEKEQSNIPTNQANQNHQSNVTIQNPEPNVVVNQNSPSNVRTNQNDETYAAPNQNLEKGVATNQSTVTNQAPTRTEAKPAATQAEQKSEPSTFDLLSDIDFSVEQSPLMPEIKVPQISEKAIFKSTAPKIEPIMKPVVKEEVIERPAKRDLFSDPSLLNQFTQEVKNLQKLMDSLTNKTASGLTVLDAKWKSFQDVQAKENMSRSKSIAMKHTPGNIVTEVVPYDDSRVTLKSDPDAYINASYYKQLAPWCIPLVISKCPKEREYTIFWKAVLEYKISCIVCLLREIEIQGNAYWPTAKGQSIDLSDGLRVTLEDVSCTVHWTERNLSISLGKNVSKITHYQINVFPAKIVCSPLVLLADKILSTTYTGRLSNQLAGAWLQCAAGAGRSAALSLLLLAMCEVRAGYLHLCDMLDAGCINLYKHRTNILEDTKYLADAYRTVLFYAQGVLCSGTTNFNGEAVSVASGASILPPVPPSPAPSTSNKSKFSKESFEEMRQAPGLKSGDMKDPLNFLDPLWSLKKK